MHLLSRLTGSVAAAALLLSAAGPAAARDGHWGKRHRHHDRGPSAGAVIGAVVGIGLLAAIASSASKKKEAERRTEDAAPYPDEEAVRYDERDDALRYDDARADRGGRDAAVDACALAARAQASRGGDYAEIKSINGVSARNGGWNVSGSVEQRSGYSATAGWQRNFRCSWQDGQVNALSVD